MRNQMRKTAKAPTLSLLLLLVGYAAIGWLLAIYKANVLLWFSTGAIAFGSAWIFALGWAIAAVLLVFSSRSQILSLAIGICLVWALLMFIARNEVQSMTDNKVQRFLILTLVAALGMGLGWLADSTIISSLGVSLMKLSPPLK
jgi:hypothetical protein